MSERLTPNNENTANGAEWYSGDVSFIERYGLQEKFSLSHYESYEGIGGAGATNALPLSNGFYAVFIESNTPVPERLPSQIYWRWDQGSPAYESRTATALLFDEENSFAGHISSGSKVDETKFSIDTFAFNEEMTAMLPSEVADAVQRIMKKDRTLGLEIDKAYRGQGLAKELTMLLIAYVQNKGAKRVVVGTDSTLRRSPDTGEVTSFYQQTGAEGPAYETGGWEYDVDEVVRTNEALLVKLLNI